MWGWRHLVPQVAVQQGVDPPQAEVRPALPDLHRRRPACRVSGVRGGGVKEVRGGWGEGGEGWLG